MRSSGQKWAITQLEQIAFKSDGAFEVVEITEPPEEGGRLTVSVSVDCTGYRQAEGGIPLSQRERLQIFIAPRFPLEVPKLHFSHSEYRDFPHVQWGRSICLYQSPETEWQPHDGMFGFVERMHEWLAAGASGTLDPIGFPLHPPIAYQQHTDALAVIPTQDTPAINPPWWSGYARIAEENDVRLELGEWMQHGHVSPETRVAPAILLSGNMPHEYPDTFAQLKRVLEQRDVPVDILRLLMSLGALRTPEGKPLVFVLGAAMRGMAGSERKQHLAAWRIKPEQACELRNAALAATDENPLDELLFKDWTERANIDWCTVLEDRPEIVVQRDTGTSAEYWRDRHIAILGCGAIGSTASMLLARAGVRKLQLYDKAIVKPGLLVRQLFDRQQVGYGKATATRINVRYINPKIEVVPTRKDVLTLLSETEAAKTLLEADVIIDATASNRVAAALEYYLRDWPKVHPPILSMSIGHRADTGLMTLAQRGVPGIAQDLDRRIKLAFADSPNGTHFLDEFWPNKLEGSRLFQPEPGCSDPTFVGSATDIAGLTSRMLNVASVWLAKGAGDRAYGFGTRIPATPQIAAKAPLEAEFSWPSDGIYLDPRHGYQIRLTPEAKRAILSWIRKSERQRGKCVETGGVLFGQIDDYLKIVWITVASGPPPDSIASPCGFICGTSGVGQMNDTLVTRSRGSISFVGMWHTHPGGIPETSPIDRAAMIRLFSGTSFRGRHFLMFIVGGSSAAPLIAASLFDRDE